jgi:hypothetical protein
MVSLEHDQTMHKRAEFNNPFYFIKVKNETTDNFISNDANDIGSVFWFDYDGGISNGIINDIVSLSTKIKIGDFVFVTVYAGPPRVIEKENDSNQLAWIKDTFGEIAGKIKLEDMEDSKFWSAIHKLLYAGFLNGFAQRRDGELVPLLQVRYSDSTPMISVGGAFLAGGQSVAIKGKINRELPFLCTTDCVVYEIRSLHLTERERTIFDRAVTSPKRQTRYKNQLKEIGFEDVELQAYSELIRYLPRYVETIV